ncbi:hypothetical protein HY389_00665, partial [Candidatus Daviesbacteria bacterium]|nr:hypothetical protein [Candidatus Daviesbacteria bacterium]
MKKASKLPLKKLGLILGLTLLIPLSITLTFLILFFDKIYPAISIAHLSVSGYSQIQAEQLLQNTLNQRLNQTLNFNHSGQNFQLNLATTSAQINWGRALTQAYNLGRSQPYFT